MANYKGIRFSNSIESYKGWHRHFPNLLSSYDSPSFKQKFFNIGNMYCSVELVDAMGVQFAGIGYHRYDDKERDFLYVPDQEGYKYFKEQINATRKEWGITRR